MAADTPAAPEATSPAGAAGASSGPGRRGPRGRRAPPAVGATTPERGYDPGGYRTPGSCPDRAAPTRSPVAGAPRGTTPQTTDLQENAGEVAGVTGHRRRPPDRW